RVLARRRARPSRPRAHAAPRDARQPRLGRALPAVLRRRAPEARPLARRRAGDVAVGGKRLRERDRALAAHRGDDRADLLRLHAREHHAQRLVVELIENLRGLIRPHVLVDARDAAVKTARSHVLDAGARGIAAQRFGDGFLERLERRSTLRYFALT